MLKSRTCFVKLKFSQNKVIKNIKSLYIGIYKVCQCKSCRSFILSVMFNNYFIYKTYFRWLLS